MMLTLPYKFHLFAPPPSALQLVVMVHLSNMLGSVLPAADVCRLAHKVRCRAARMRAAAELRDAEMSWHCSSLHPSRTAIRELQQHRRLPPPLTPNC